MYTPNGSAETRFEALIVRVPWPAWLAELERTQFDNAKFVPVHLVDHTAGYDSECAVLFPETVSVAGKRPTRTTFGGIFCDREARRYRTIVGRGGRSAAGQRCRPSCARCWLRAELTRGDVRCCGT